MKKSIYLTLIASLFGLHSALAVETTQPQLVPATSLEEMMNSNVDETEAASVADFDHHRDHRGVVCFARNRRGQRFEARGFNPRETQEEAMRSCYHSRARHCFELGCHRN